MLEKIQSPQDVKALSAEELTTLAGEIRDKMIETVSKNGGHLASNLGVVEVTLALHKVFCAPQDKFVFDVGHQCYAHKLITGRFEAFDTLRKKDGVSGFMRRGESEYDVMSEGHSGASLSHALGIAEANKLLDSDDYTVALVGDGALTNGMIYEALNNCTDKSLRLLIVVNDNGMSISPNIGGVHNHLTKLRTSKRYFSFKYRLERVLKKIPLIGRPIEKFLRAFKKLLKNIFVRSTVFDDMGVTYYGPIDGHNLKKLVNIFEEAKSHNSIAVVNVKTQKGKGYAFAEEEPEKYHSVAPFDKEKGVCAFSEESFTLEAGRLLQERAEEDSRICALTAAMCDGTGLNAFQKRFPERFFDVGIAEEHAVAFAGGLAANCMKPVFMVYSTFSQRISDQLIHDVSLQNLPLTLLLDHCGFVEGDGITHQGIFDVPLFSAVPHTRIYAPVDYGELAAAIDKGLAGTGITIVRYPKGKQIRKAEETDEGDFAYTPETEKARAVIVTYGRVSANAQRAANALSQTVKTGVVRLKKIYPIDFERLSELTKNAELVYCLEEGYKVGGVGEKIQAGLCGKIKGSIKVHAVEDFVPHASLEELFETYGFTVEKISEEINSFFAS